MFSDERSLRRRLMIQHTTEDIHGAGYVYPYLQDELTKTFLYSITPRPTVKELASVLTEEDKQKRKKIMRHIIQSRSKPAA